MDDRYWNRTGTAQAHYDEMDAAGFKFTKATEAVFHSYYRYYNAVSYTHLTLPTNSQV